MKGYDRGMVYRFGADDSGEVIYENIRESSRQHIKSSYLNMRFPAGDIPLIARQLYIKNGVRFIIDVNGSDSKLLSTINTPLDLTMSCLRSSAPVHLSYLRNMGVVASMSIAIVVNGKLWGLYVFHSYSKSVRPSVEQRIMFEMLGAISSMRIDSFERDVDSKRKISLSKTMLTSPSYKNLIEFLRVNTTEICSILDIHAIILYDANVGKMIFGDESIALTDEGYGRILNLCQDKSVVAISNFKHYLSGDGAGLIFYKQSFSSIAIIRKSIVADVVWGGVPDKVVDENNRLQPRNSFEAFYEKARVECKPWTEIDKQLAEQFFERCIDQIHLETLDNFRISLDQSNSESMKAIESAEELYEFFAHMSHELRTPFHGVISALQLLDAGSSIDEKERKDIVKSALECGSHMLKTLDDILTIAKSRHNVEADRKPMSISNLISTCKRMMDPLAEAKQIRFSILLSNIYNDISDSWENVTILSDETKILQTINNLTNNAIKFTPVNGFVKLNVSLFNRRNAKERWNELKSYYHGSCVINDQIDPHNSFDIDNEPVLMFEVSDSGCGIIESNMSAMFNAYKQLSQGVEKVYQGTGLGLHICRSHIKILNGFICIASTINVGSVISFIIPANIINTKVATKIADVDYAMDTFDEVLSKSVHFLVVDDSQVNLRLTRRKLQLAMGNNINTTMACDGLEAIEIVENMLIENKSNDLTAILMDYHMPNCSGLQAIKRIRLLENQYNSNPIHIVAFTADVNEKSCNELLDAGANEVLSKPSPTGKLENICINVAKSKLHV
eukprot:gene19432-25311_t